MVAYDSTDWICIDCELIDDSNNLEVKKAVIEEFDWVEEEGYTLTNPDFQILYIANAQATIYKKDGTFPSYQF